MRMMRVNDCRRLVFLLAVAAVNGAFARDAGCPAGKTADRTAHVEWPMERLLQPPKTFDASRYATNGNVQVTFFEGLPYRGRETRVFAYYGVPKHEPGKNVPAMVLVHGGGGSAFYRWVKFWNDRGYAAISMDTCGAVSGNTIGQEQFKHYRHDWSGPAGWGGFRTMDDPVCDQWMYHAVADVILAHSLIRSLPGVDPDRVGLTGVSWGGIIACTVASLDARFRFAAPVYGCGGNFIQSPAWEKNTQELGPANRPVWEANWDPIVYLPRSRVPVHWLDGTNDPWFALPAIERSRAAHAARNGATLRIRMVHAHGAVSEQAGEIVALAEHYLRNGPDLPRFGALSVAGGTVNATFSSSPGLVPERAVLDYTLDRPDARGVWFAREWRSCPAKIDGSVVSAVLPAGARAFYLNLETADGIRSSSHVCDLDAKYAEPKAAESFQAARPVWTRGEESLLNAFCAVRGTFDCPAGAAAVVRVTAAYDYRVRLNGAFVGFGPIRGPEGVFRIDEWKLPVRDGANVVEIEAAGYNVNSYYFLKQPSFVQAEVLVDGAVVAATGADGAFRPYDAGRLRKVTRYSGQRTFIDAWRVGAPRPAPPLAEQPMRKYEARPMAYPDFAANRSFRPIRKERLTRDPALPIARASFVEKCADPGRARFAVDELETNPYYELQTFRHAPLDGEPTDLSAGESATFEGDLNVAGFLGVKVRTDGPCRLVIAWDEILSKDGVLDFKRLDSAAVAEWRIASAGTYELETFEPSAAKYIDVIALDGKAKVDSVWVRTYASPLADRTSFRASDPALERIFRAARESYRANAVDGFTDCPTRERAYWTGDTFFTGRAAGWLTGDGSVERTFLANFLLTGPFDWSQYDSKGVDMTGAIPALYPGGVQWSNFIPNYMIWTVLQLEEYVGRYGDRELARQAKPTILGIVRFLRKFRNADGLLERLPGWVFVEWSKANQLVQDVNYPSNMMYARMLETCARLYAMPELADEAAAVRREVLRQSWTGEWFCDNAVRQKDGTLRLSGECTETCQYCAFFFGLVKPTDRPALWTRLLDEFGPDRVKKGLYGRIWPANFIFGTCERLDLLSRAGRSRQILAETRDWFLAMAERTGTLWEHLDTRASCCHGFSSIASEYLFRDILGVREIDRVAKTVRVAPADDLPLDWCEGTLPLSRGEFATVSWRKTGGRVAVEVKLPQGWTRK